MTRSKGLGCPTGTVTASALALALGLNMCKTSDDSAETPVTSVEQSLHPNAPSPIDSGAEETREAIEEQIETMEDLDTGDAPEGSFTLSELSKAAEILQEHRETEARHREWRKQIVAPAIANALNELGYELVKLDYGMFTRAEFIDAEGDRVSMLFDWSKQGQANYVDHGKGQITPYIAVGQVYVSGPDGQPVRISQGTKAVPYNLLSAEIEKALQEKYTMD